MQMKLRQKKSLDIYRMEQEREEDDYKYSVLFLFSRFFLIEKKNQ